jgi:predicted transcriptional regulator
MPIEKPIKENPRTSKQRRSKFEIAIEILAAVQETRNEDNGASRRTWIQGRVIISWKALKKHLADLEKEGLLEKGELRLTRDGQEFLQKYRQDLRRVFEKYRLLT